MQADSEVAQAAFMLRSYLELCERFSERGLQPRDLLWFIAMTAGQLSAASGMTPQELIAALERRMLACQQMDLLMALATRERADQAFADLKGRGAEATNKQHHGTKA